MSEILKGVPCDDCFGTYDSHEDGCVQARLAAKDARISALEARLEKAEGLAKAASLVTDLSPWSVGIMIREIEVERMDGLSKALEAWDSSQ